jgi:hypothetical protein
VESDNACEQDAVVLCHWDIFGKYVSIMPGEEIASAPVHKRPLDQHFDGFYTFRGVESGVAFYCFRGRLTFQFGQTPLDWKRSRLRVKYNLSSYTLKSHATVYSGWRKLYEVSYESNRAIAYKLRDMTHDGMDDDDDFWVSISKVVSDEDAEQMRRYLVHNGMEKPSE